MSVHQLLDKTVQTMSTIEKPSYSTRKKFDDISRTNRTAALMQAFTRAIISVQSSLLRLEDGKYRTFAKMDLHWLAFAQLDLVAERTEFSTGIERDRVIIDILPLACEQAEVLGYYSQLGTEGLKVGLELLFDALCNRGERYKAFKVPTWDAEQKRFAMRKFWLLKSIVTDEDCKESNDSLFELTDEAYLLLFGMMEQDALDLARINVLRMEMLLSRGAFSEAVSLADSNARQAQRQTVEIRTLRRRIIRRIGSVDIERIEHLGSEGVRQVDKFQQDLDSLSTIVRQHLNTGSDPDQQRQLSRLKEKLDEQRKATIRLQKEIMDLPDTFREHQHKLFRRRDLMPGRGLPPIDSAIQSLADFPIGYINRVAEEFIARLSPPVAVDLFDPGSMLQQLNCTLERRPHHDVDTVTEDEDIELPEEYESSITPQMVVSVRQWMRSVIPSEGELLSNLLRRALQEHDIDTAVAVQGIALISLDPHDEAGMAAHFRFHASPSADRYNISLGDGRRVHGHELTLSVQLNTKSKT